MGRPCSLTPPGSRVCPAHPPRQLRVRRAGTCPGRALCGWQRAPRAALLSPHWLMPPQGSAFREVHTHRSHPPGSGPPLPFSLLASSKPGMPKGPGATQDTETGPRCPWAPRDHRGADGPLSSPRVGEQGPLEGRPLGLHTCPQGPAQFRLRGPWPGRKCSGDWPLCRPWPDGAKLPASGSWWRRHRTPAERSFSGRGRGRGQLQPGAGPGGAVMAAARRPDPGRAGAGAGLPWAQGGWGPAGSHSPATCHTTRLSSVFSHARSWQRGARQAGTCPPDPGKVGEAFLWAPGAGANASPDAAWDGGVGLQHRLSSCPGRPTRARVPARPARPGTRPCRRGQGTRAGRGERRSHPP